jgi:hypothetical protein
MVYHHLRGSPWQHPLEDGVGEGVGNITYPRGKATLLYNQLVSHPHHMPIDTLNILLQTCPRLSMMCNRCMNGRVQNSTLCWSLNGKQLPYRRGKLGTTIMQAWWQIDVLCSCRSTITIWHNTLGWCINEFYVFGASIVWLLCIVCYVVYM